MKGDAAAQPEPWSPCVGAVCRALTLPREWKRHHTVTGRFQHRGRFANITPPRTP